MALGAGIGAADITAGAVPGTIDLMLLVGAGSKPAPTCGDTALQKTDIPHPHPNPLLEGEGIKGIYKVRTTEGVTDP